MKMKRWLIQVGIIVGIMGIIIVIGMLVPKPFLGTKTEEQVQQSVDTTVQQAAPLSNADMMYIILKAVNKYEVEHGVILTNPDNERTFAQVVSDALAGIVGVSNPAGVAEQLLERDEDRVVFFDRMVEALVEAATDQVGVLNPDLVELKEWIRERPDLVELAQSIKERRD